MKKTKKNGLEFYSTRYLKSKRNPVRVLRYSWRIWHNNEEIAVSKNDYSKLSGAVNNIKSVASMIKYGQYIEEAISNYKNRKK